VENQYFAKHRCLPVNKLQTVLGSHHLLTATASGSDQSFLDPYDLSSDDVEYLMPDNAAETPPGQSDRTAHVFTPARLNLNSPPEARKNLGQVNPNLNDYHSDPVEISSTFGYWT